ncbi:MAG: carboxypeptidase-like regulatory domain-containing protein [Puniceicoccales bacterium]|nr:carboxypeptidase-like regulatory domain-containing protein [Puniceicoccales bacterium]
MSGCIILPIPVSRKCGPYLSEVQGIVVDKSTALPLENAEIKISYAETQAVGWSGYSGEWKDTPPFIKEIKITQSNSLGQFHVSPEGEWELLLIRLIPNLPNGQVSLRPYIVEVSAPGYESSVILRDSARGYHLSEVNQWAYRENDVLDVEIKLDKRTIGSENNTLGETNHQKE